MAYSELIKNFEKVRSYMRDFYVYGFKGRDEFDAKSARIREAVDIVEIIKPVYNFKAAEKLTDYTTGFFTPGIWHDRIVKC